MPVKLNIPFLLKRLLTIAVVVTVLCIVLIFIGRGMLASRGISFESVSFRFPSTATIRGLSIKTSALEIQAGLVRAHWSWRALLRRNFRSNFVEVNDATVRLSPSENTGNTATSTPLLDIRRIALQNVRLISTAGKDSTLVTLRDFRAIGFRYDGKLRLDTLLNTNSDFLGIYTPAETSTHDSITHTSASFSIQSLPEFTVGHFRFTDCDFSIRYDTTQYLVSRFNLLFSGLNNHNAMNMKLQRLAFRYQDSVDVDLALDDVTFEKDNTARINQILLELPGLRIDVPEATLSGEAFALDARFDSSYVDTNLLRFIIPSLHEWLPPDSRIGVDGRVGFRSGQLMLERTSVSLDEDGIITGSGIIQWASGGDSVNVVIQRIESSLYGLARWSAVSIPPDQSNFPIKGQLHAEGTYKDLRTYGNLALGALELRYRARITDVRGGTRIAFDLTSPDVEPQKIITQFGNDLKIANGRLEGSATFGENSVRSLQARLRADSAFQSQRWYAAPVIDVDYAPVHTVATVTLDDGSYSASLDITGNIRWGDKLNCNGSVHIGPQSDNVVEGFRSEFTARFNGIVYPRDSVADIHFDTVSLKTPDHHLYTSSGRLQVSRSEEQSLQVALVLNKYLDLNARLGDDILEWLDSEDKLTHFPSLTLALNAHADTTLMKALTGTPAYIELERVNLVSTREEVNISFSSDTLYWQDFHTHALKGELRYYPDYLTGKIETPELITPAAVMDSMRFEVTTKDKSDFYVSLDTYLPEIDRAIGLRYKVASQQDGFRISFGDSTMQLGINRWRADLNDGLHVDRSFNQFSGRLSISHQSQQAILQGNGAELTWILKDIDISPITKAIASEPEIHGILNASVAGNFQDGAYRWTGSLTRTSIDTVSFGDFVCNGSMTDDSLAFTGQLADHNYSVSGMINKSKQRPAQFGLQAKNIDFRKFSSLLPAAASTLTVTGIMNAEVSGSSGETLMMKGYVSLPDLEIISPEYDIYLKSDRDSLILNGTTARLDNFVFRDRYGKPLTINGSANLAGQTLDLSIRTDRFRLLDRTLKKATITGEMDLTCDLNVRGRKGAYKVSGTMGTLDGASVTYLYKTTVTLDEREQEIEFVSFNEKKTAVREKPDRRRKTKPTEWDVNFDVGKVDVTVLFSQVNQDHIKTTASGKVAFTTGNSAEPSAFGIIESNSGDIAYHVPMISNLRMTINKAGIRWVGDVGKPLLSFHGAQTFRITPNEISSLWTNKTDRWPISVIAKISDRALNDLVLNFDLSSTNNDVANWITTLPPDTRQAYAVSLLIRGRINTGGSADVNLLTQTMVSKMNEISSRNIKSADVSFYDESRGPNSTEGSTSKIGYSITKGLANRKMRIVVGGSVDLTGQADPSMPDVKLEYVLREDPTITLRAGKANVYTGVIDGNVDESSFGFTYIKRFRNLFHSHQKQPKE